MHKPAIVRWAIRIRWQWEGFHPHHRRAGLESAGNHRDSPHLGDARRALGLDPHCGVRHPALFCVAFSATGVGATAAGNSLIPVSDNRFIWKRTCTSRHWKAHEFIIQSV
jgi:hypothetical protein